MQFKRDSGLDFLRAMSILYIVGAYHLLEDTEVAFWFYTPATRQYAILAMAIFVAMSGFLLSARTNTSHPNWLKRFVAARLVRIYIPFVAALALFVITHTTNKTVAFYGAILAGMFTQQPPPTLWFVDMLIIFYALAAILIWRGDNKVWFCAIAICMMVITYLGTVELNVADDRLLIYLPAFLWGLALGRWPQLLSKLPAWMTLAALVLTTNVVPQDPQGHPLPYAALALIGSHLAMQLSRADLALYRSAWVLAISEASFFMYLLHRPILKLLNDHFQPETAGMQVLFLYGLCLPLIYVVARITQKAYDRVAAPWLMRRMASS